jgi:hypothetical protein
MAYKPETPFDSIEGALEYVSLLAETVEETQADIAAELAEAKTDGAGAARRADALQIVAYKLDRLASHARASRRLLNDLRTLRRLLLDERSLEAAAPPVDVRPAEVRAARKPSPVAPPGPPPPRSHP